ncbi:KH domain-containing protein [Patescibacteria group bacterium]
MEKLLKLIVESIVLNPKSVKISLEEKENFVNLRLEVDPEDLKFVIGKKGRTIRAIRNLLRLRAANEKKRVNLELVEA